MHRWLAVWVRHAHSTCVRPASKLASVFVQGPELTADLAEGLSQYDGYKNSASKQLIASVQAGKQFPDAAAKDDQAHSLIKVPLVVARYIGADLVPREVVVHVSCGDLAHLVNQQVVHFGSRCSSVNHDVIMQRRTTPLDLAASLCALAFTVPSMVALRSWHRWTPKSCRVQPCRAARLARQGA
jgi:hypothetical protein